MEYLRVRTNKPNKMVSFISPNKSHKKTHSFKSPDHCSFKNSTTK